MHGIHSTPLCRGFAPFEMFTFLARQAFLGRVRTQESIGLDRRLGQKFATNLAYKTMEIDPNTSQGIGADPPPACRPAGRYCYGGGRWRSVAAASPVEPHKPAPLQPRTATTGASPTPPVLHPLSPQPLPYLSTWRILLQGRGARTVDR